MTPGYASCLGPPAAYLALARPGATPGRLPAADFFAEFSGWDGDWVSNQNCGHPFIQATVAHSNIGCPELLWVSRIAEGGPYGCPELMPTRSAARPDVGRMADWLSMAGRASGFAGPA